jgi:hypothetical protein
MWVVSSRTENKRTFVLLPQSAFGVLLGKDAIDLAIFLKTY